MAELDLDLDLDIILEEDAQTKNARLEKVKAALEETQKFPAKTEV